MLIFVEQLFAVSGSSGEECLPENSSASPAARSTAGNEGDER